MGYLNQMYCMENVLNYISCFLFIVIRVLYNEGIS
jgi:hypothetical protein